MLLRLTTCRLIVISASAFLHMALTSALSLKGVELLLSSFASRSSDGIHDTDGRDHFIPHSRSQRLAYIPAKWNRLADKDSRQNRRDLLWKRDGGRVLEPRKRNHPFSGLFKAAQPCEGR